MTTNVSFELAKLLKEKGFKKECLFYYNKQGELPERWESSGSSTDTDVPIYLEEFEANFNSPNLVGVHQIGDVSCSAPTIAEVVMWLYEKYEVWISSEPFIKNDNSVVNIYKIFKEGIIDTISRGSLGYDSPTEAYEASIEYVLTKILG